MTGSGGREARKPGSSNGERGSSEENIIVESGSVSLHTDSSSSSNKDLFGQDSDSNDSDDSTQKESADDRVYVEVDKIEVSDVDSSTLGIKPETISFDLDSDIKKENKSIDIKQEKGSKKTILDFFSKGKGADSKEGSKENTKPIRTCKCMYCQDKANAEKSIEECNLKGWIKPYANSTIPTEVIEEINIDDVPAPTLPPQDENLMKISKISSNFSLGKEHPSSLAESSSLSAVKLPLIPPTFQLRLPLQAIENGNISNPQLQAVTLASYRFQQPMIDNYRSGFFLGDGTGCGKGRMIAATILDAWNRGIRRHLWISISADMVVDARRDLDDVGASHIPIFSLKNLQPQEDIDNPKVREGVAKKINVCPLKWRGEGVLFTSYSLLVSGSNSNAAKTRFADLSKTNPVKLPLAYEDHLIQNGEVLDIVTEEEKRAFQIAKEAYNETNSSTLGSCTCRFEQVLRFLRREKESIIVLDESHKAKNVSNSVNGSMTGKIILLLQKLCNTSPVFYASATGCTELKHLRYLERLNIWGPNTSFLNFDIFKSKIEKGGVSSLECIALNLKLNGLYLSRALSYENVLFSVNEVKMSPYFIDIWKKSSNLFLMIRTLMKCTGAAEAMGDDDVGEVDDEDEEEDEPIKPASGSKKKKESSGKEERERKRKPEASANSIYFSCVQRFFKQLLVCSKIPGVIKLVKEELQANNSVVISLWSTGDSRIKDKVNELESKGISISNDESILSSPMLIIEHLLTHSIFQKAKKAGEGKELYQKIQAALSEMVLPNNPIDDLIYHLGGPEQVAELSGRTHRIHTKWKNNKIKIGYVSRSNFMSYDGKFKVRDDEINLLEQLFFQTGIKKVAIITEAASAGISLHSDKARSKYITMNRRVMFPIEIPWSADKILQQLGRIHRSNQLHNPTYKMMVSNIVGEKRFIACIASRLKSLGALTKGDRRAAIASGEGKENAGDLKKETGDFGNGFVEGKMEIKGDLGDEVKLEEAGDKQDKSYYKDIKFIEWKRNHRLPLNSNFALDRIFIKRLDHSVRSARRDDFDEQGRFILTMTGNRSRMEDEDSLSESMESSSEGSIDFDDFINDGSDGVSDSGERSDVEDNSTSSEESSSSDSSDTGKGRKRGRKLKGKTMLKQRGKKRKVETESEESDTVTESDETSSEEEEVKKTSAKKKGKKVASESEEEESKKSKKIVKKVGKKVLSESEGATPKSRSKKPPASEESDDDSESSEEESDDVTTTEVSSEEEELPVKKKNAAAKPVADKNSIVRHLTKRQQMFLDSQKKKDKMLDRISSKQRKAPPSPIKKIAKTKPNNKHNRKVSTASSDVDNNSSDNEKVKKPEKKSLSSDGKSKKSGNEKAKKKESSGKDKKKSSNEKGFKKALSGSKDTDNEKRSEKSKEKREKKTLYDDQEERKDENQLKTAEIIKNDPVEINEIQQEDFLELDLYGTVPSKALKELMSILKTLEFVPNDLIPLIPYSTELLEMLSQPRELHDDLLNNAMKPNFNNELAMLVQFLSKTGDIAPLARIEKYSIENNIKEERVKELENQISKPWNVIKLELSLIRSSIQAIELDVLYKKTTANNASSTYSMDTFLNRLLLLPVTIQACLFNFFMYLHDIIQGQNFDDDSVVSLNKAHGIQKSLKIHELAEDVIHIDPSTGIRTLHHKLEMDRGVPYKEALNMYKQFLTKEKLSYLEKMSGFYCYGTFKSRRIYFLAIHKYDYKGTGDAFYIVKPNIGCLSVASSSTYLSRFTKITDYEDNEALEESWNDQYDLSFTQCYHMQINNTCSHSNNANASAGGSTVCNIGKRLKHVSVLSGSFLKLWNTIEELTSDSFLDINKILSKKGETEVVEEDHDNEDKNKNKLRLVRGSLPNGKVIIGVRIPTIATSKLHILRDILYLNIQIRGAGGSSYIKNSIVARLYQLPPDAIRYVVRQIVECSRICVRVLSKQFQVAANTNTNAEDNTPIVIDNQLAHGEATTGSILSCIHKISCVNVKSYFPFSIEGLEALFIFLLHLYKYNITTAPIYIWDEKRCSWKVDMLSTYDINFDTILLLFPTYHHLNMKAPPPNAHLGKVGAIPMGKMPIPSNPGLGKMPVGNPGKMPMPLGGNGKYPMPSVGGKMPMSGPPTIGRSQHPIPLPMGKAGIPLGKAGVPIGKVSTPIPLLGKGVPLLGKSAGASISTIGGSMKPSL